MLGQHLLYNLHVKNDDFKISQGTLWDGKYLYELYQKAYTPWEWHQEIFDLANELGLVCFSSPFDKTAVDFLENLDGSTKLLFADVNSKESLKSEDLKDSKSLCILIGPEGDFSPSERETILRTLNVKSFTISRNILRSDTAVISAISLVNFINNFN